jgi:hypothetical protein
VNFLVLNPGQYLCAKTISFRLTLSAVAGLLEMMEDGGGGLGKDSSMESVIVKRHPLQIRMAERVRELAQQEFFL